MKTNCLHIFVNEFSKQQLNGRSSVKAIGIDDNRDPNVNLDFKDISFISRSAADELLELKNSFEKRSKNMIFTNCDPFVENMINKVYESRKTKFKSYSPLERMSNDEKETEEFLIHF